MPRYNEPTHRAAKIAYTFVVCTATHPEGDASTDARCRGEHHADDAEPKGVDGLRRRPKARHAGDGTGMAKNDDEQSRAVWPGLAAYCRLGSFMQSEIGAGLVERIFGALNLKFWINIPRDFFCVNPEFSRPVLLSSLY